MGFFTTRSFAVLAATAAVLIPVQAQTYTECNPLKKTCPPNEALGGEMDIDFTGGERDDFIVSGDVSYNSDGLELAVSKENRGPYMQSEWYMMFGRVDVTMKAAPGGGVVSSFILQSDDLDEIDLEWVGSDAGLLQTNFFGKGFAGTYNRGENYHTDDASADYHTYTIDWNAERIQWIADGKVLRTLLPDDFPGQYPQSPMFVKFGPWAAGDPTNNPKGTVQWADGPIDWNAGPYPMNVQTITAADYSTGTQYKYTDKTGTWESIEAVGGSVNADATEASGKADPGESSPSSSSEHSTKTSSTKESSSKPTSTKDHSTKETSKPTTTKDSSESHSATSHAAPGGGSSSASATGGSPTPTGSSENNSSDPSSDSPSNDDSNTDSNDDSNAPENGVDGTKQVALGLSLVCAMVGIVAAF